MSQNNMSQSVQSVPGKSQDRLPPGEPATANPSRMGMEKKEDGDGPKEEEKKICRLRKKIFFIALAVVLVVIIIIIIIAVVVSNQKKTEDEATTKKDPQPTMEQIIDITTALVTMVTTALATTETTMETTMEEITTMETTSMKPPFEFVISRFDPHSFSNPDQVHAESYHFDWDVDFDRKVISGSILYNLVADDKDVKDIVFDTRSNLKIKKVSVPKRKRQAEEPTLDFEFGPPYKSFGTPLRVTLPPLQEDAKKRDGKLRTKIMIDFETSQEASALQWLSPEQTGDKTEPFLFSQNEAIHARSLFPCQDSPQTKATFTASVTAPKNLVVLMGAVSTGAPQPVPGKPDKMVHMWAQKVPIVSYLVAIAVGKLQSHDLGDTTRIWAESYIIEGAAQDFSETKQMVKTAEALVGEYVWGRYDMLLLPPSFPYGGMEHPCLTFLSPALVSGDKALANVVAHEISHSWTGNLVTNVNFEHFWLNEGFTVFLERKILGELSTLKLKARDFASLNGLSDLIEVIKDMHEDNPLTQLVVNLTGLDPDDTFSIVPYEKGSLFLYYLETQIGGPKVMNAFLKDYVQKFLYKSLDTEEWKSYFVEWMDQKGQSDLIKNVTWDTWLYQPGQPTIIPEYDQTLYQACVALKDKWVAPSWEAINFESDAADILNFTPGQVQGFLQLVLNAENPLLVERLQKMQSTYKFGESKNVEILWRWIRCGLRQEVKWEEQVPVALKFVTANGRMKYIRPVYRDLYAWGGDVRQQAIDTFKANEPNMMAVAANNVRKDLHLTDEEEWRIGSLHGPRPVWSHGRFFL